MEALEDLKPDDMKYTNQKSTQMKVVITIQQYLSDGARYHVFNLEDTTQMWKILAKWYTRKMSMSKALLKVKLYGLRMTEGTKLHTHIDYFQSLFVEL